MPQVFAAVGVKKLIIWVVLTVASYVLAPKPKAFRQRAASFIRAARGSILGQRVIYGTTRVGGAVVFRHSDGEDLYEIHVLANHEVNDIVTPYVDDAVFASGGFGWSGNHGTVSSGAYAGLVEIWKYYGTSSQVADPGLVALTAKWTSDHRLRGRAYVVIKVNANQENWPNGPPQWSFVVEGKNDVFDPRDNTTKFTNNAALCLADYLYNSSFGLNAGSIASNEYTEIDDTDLVAAANVCEEAVALDAGGTQDRYTVDGAFELDGTSHEDRVTDFLTAMGAGSSCFWSQGKWRIIAGAHSSSAGTITIDDLAGPIQVQPRVSRSELFNYVKGTYVSAAEDYIPTDYPPISNGTYETEDDQRLPQEVDFYFVNDGIRCQRLAKTFLEDSRQQIVVNLECKMSCLTYRVGDRVALTLDRYGWSSKLFRIVEASVAVDGGQGDDGPTLTVRLTLKETASAVYTWSAEETAVDPAPDTELLDRSSIADPTGFSIVSYQARTSNEGIVKHWARISWTNPTAEHHAYTEVRYRTGTPVGVYQYARVDKNTTATTLGPINSGGTLTVGVRAVSEDGIKSNWVSTSGTADNASSDYIGKIAGRRGRLAQGELFYETFRDADDGWTKDFGSGSVAAKTGIEASEGVGLEVTGGWWAHHQDLIPFDPEALYMVELRARLTTAPTDSAKDLLYFGIVGFAEDGTTKISTTGANTFDDAHYFGANGVDMGAWTLNEWNTVRGFFRGWDAAAAVLSPNEADDPALAYPGIRWFVPMLAALWDDASDGKVELDFFRVKTFDADGHGRTYATLSRTRGRLKRGSRMERASDTAPIARAIQSGQAGDGDSITFSPAFDEVPTIQLIPENVKTRHAAWDTDTTRVDQKLILRADALTTSGFTMYAKVSQLTGSTTARTASLVEDSTPVDDVDETTTATKTQAAEAVDDTYEFQYDVELQAAVEFGNPEPTEIIESECELAFEARNAAGSWVEYATASFSNNDPDASATYSNQKKSIVVDGLVANAEFRIRVKSEFRLTSVTGDDVSWVEATPPSSVSATPDLDNKVRWVAVEGS